MTHQAPFAAVHAAIAASRSGASVLNGATTSHLDPHSQDFHRSAPSPEPDPRAIDLLARVMAQGLPQDPLIISVCSCSVGMTGGLVARALAVASASRFGRTLLLDAYAAHLPSIPVSSDTGDYAASGQALPDAFRPGLCHRNLDATWLQSRPLYGAALLAHVLGLASGYTMVVVDSPCPRKAAASLALAAVCHAAILISQAGSTCSSHVNDTARAIEGVGGRVIGTVLDQIPAGTPRWLERSCGL